MNIQTVVGACALIQAIASLATLVSFIAMLKRHVRELAKMREDLSLYDAIARRHNDALRLFVDRTHDDNCEIVVALRMCVDGLCLRFPLVGEQQIDNLIAMVRGEDLPDLPPYRSAD